MRQPCKIWRTKFHLVEHNTFLRNSPLNPPLAGNSSVLQDGITLYANMTVQFPPGSSSQAGSFEITLLLQVNLEKFRLVSNQCYFVFGTGTGPRHGKIMSSI